MKTGRTLKQRAALALTAVSLACAISCFAIEGRDSVWIVGLTNGSILSGAVQLPIKFAVTNKDAIVGVAVYDTNGPIIGANAMSVADYRYWLSRYGIKGPILADTNNDDWYLFWDTQMSANGDYAIEAELDFFNASIISPPVNVTVSNPFSFPNGISQMFGSHMWIYFQTVPGATVQIDIFGEKTNYLGSFYPTSDTNGVVSFLWDLTDGNGHPFKDTSFSGVFTLEKIPAVSHHVSKPNLRLTSLPPYMRLQKSDKKRPVEIPASSGPTTNGTYQVVCEWHGSRR